MSPYENQIQKMRRPSYDRKRSPEAKAQTIERRMLRRAKAGR